MKTENQQPIDIQKLVESFEKDAISTSNTEIVVVLLPFIQRAKLLHISYRKFLERLNEAGFPMKYRTFLYTLKRVKAMEKSEIEAIQRIHTSSANSSSPVANLAKSMASLQLDSSPQTEVQPKSPYSPQSGNSVAVVREVDGVTIVTRKKNINVINPMPDMKDFL